MARVIDGIGGQVEFALGDPDFPGLTKSGFDEVLVVGMGGSALPVDILNDVLEDYLPRPVGVCRQYELPAVRSGNRLLVFSSFSGNTEEVVEPLRSLPPEAPGVVIVTAGVSWRKSAESGIFRLCGSPRSENRRAFNHAAPAGTSSLIWLASSPAPAMVRSRSSPSEDSSLSSASWTAGPRERESHAPSTVGSRSSIRTSPTRYPWTHCEDQVQRKCEASCVLQRSARSEPQRDDRLLWSGVGLHAVVLP